MEEPSEQGFTRAFICVRFPDDVVKEIARVQEILGGWKFTGKMTELENLHVTLKFLGEIDEEMIGKVREKLEEVKVGVFEARLVDAGTFSVHGKPRIVWVKVGGKGMFELQKKIDEALEGLFEKERRFMSHLTIARVKYTKDARGFEECVRKIGVKEICFSVGEFFLMKSTLQLTGPRYTEIERYTTGSDGKA